MTYPTSFQRRWVPLWSLFHQEVTRFFRAAVQTLITPIINSILYFLIFGVNLGDNLTIIDDNHSYLEFLIPGLIVLGILNNSYQNSSSSILISKFHGSFEDLKVLPLQPYHIIWGMGLASILRGLIIGMMTGGVGVFFLWYYKGIHGFSIYSWPLLIFFSLVSGFFFGVLGISVGFIAKTFEHITAISSFILLPLIYLGGVFFPLGTLDPFWQKLSMFNPLLYYINGFRYACLGLEDVSLSLIMWVVGCSLLFIYLLAHHCIVHGNYRRW